MSMSTSQADQYAARLAASFPSARIGKETLSEWSLEFAKLTEPRAAGVLDWLKEHSESAPSFRQIRLAMVRSAVPKRDPDGWKKETPGLASDCEFCGQPVANTTGAASRYDPAKDRYFNAHMGCADAAGRGSPGPEIN